MNRYHFFVNKTNSYLVLLLKLNIGKLLIRTISLISGDTYKKSSRKTCLPLYFPTAFLNRLVVISVVSCKPKGNEYLVKPIEIKTNYYVIIFSSQ